MDYDDIINLPHHVSTKHPQMPIYNRAAQFSAFAALSGHDEAIEKATRQAQDEINLINHYDFEEMNI